MTTRTRRTLTLAGAIRPASSAVTPATAGQLRIDARALAARRDEMKPRARSSAERDHTERGWFEQQVCREAP